MTAAWAPRHHRYALDEWGELVIATTSRGEVEDIRIPLPPEQRVKGWPGGYRRVLPFESSCPAHPESGIVHAVRVTSDGRVLPVE